MYDMNDYIKQQITKSISVKQAMLDSQEILDGLHQISQLTVNALKAGHKVLWAGNGGSAADAQHMAAELVNKFRLDRPGLCSIALTTDTSILTSIGNDYGFQRVFARQVEAVGAAGDVFIGISTSGNSENLVLAGEECRRKGIVSVALVGEKPCKMDMYDHVIHVPSSDTPRIQECQTLIGHILCDLVEKSLFGTL
ncbi:MAG: D-sedoheptulose 7-phosphate isomerase [Bacteroidales bacterium]|nr:D-sedoheptulose 7-phosphate isomerase [Bacteroidales bacterium]